MNALLLSINPEHVTNILDHKKTFEFRKVVCRRDVDLMLIYCTCPIKKIVGQANIERIIVDEPEEVWKKTESGAGISKEFFDDYFSGRCVAVAYELSNAIRYCKPRDLSEYGLSSPPQSFAYVDQ